MDRIRSRINLGGVQLIPTAKTFSHDSPIAAHSDKESPLTTFTPSLELKDNQAGVFMSSSLRSSTKAWTGANSCQSQTLNKRIQTITPE